MKRLFATPQRRLVSLAVASAAPTAAVLPRPGGAAGRLYATRDLEVMPGGEQLHSQHRHHHKDLSHDVHHEHEEHYADEEFDELEAAAQEAHDICFAMVAYLRRADPEANRALFHRRVKRRFREPIPEQERRLLHTLGDKSYMRRNNFRNEKELEEATALFLELGEKLLNLLDKALVDRLIESAGKGGRDMRHDGVHRFKKPLQRATWRNFPHRWFKHAPFEVQQLRADIPESAVLNTRFYRDHSTLRSLFALMEPQHAYRAAIEKRMFEITQHYDPVQLDSLHG